MLPDQVRLLAMPKRVCHEGMTAMWRAETQVLLSSNSSKLRSDLSKLDVVCKP